MATDGTPKEMESVLNSLGKINVGTKKSRFSYIIVKMRMMAYQANATIIHIIILTIFYMISKSRKVLK